MQGGSEMIRFIDLRKQHTGYNFAFWDTVTDMFIGVCGSYAWDTYEEFEKDCEICGEKYDLKHVCPVWALGYERPKNGRACGEIILDDMVYADGNQILDKDWLFKALPTSSGRKKTSLHGTRPMHPALSEKLYTQNAMKYTYKNSISEYKTLFFKLSFFGPRIDDIKVNVTTINKYTIVELTHNNKHYHGLAARAECDQENAVTGIAVAYHRAFEKMMQAQDDIPHKPAKSFREMCKQCPEVFKPRCVAQISML